MRRAALLLAGLGLLAGCNATNGNGDSLRKKEETRAAEVAKLSGWDRLYGAPDATVSGVNQFGFKAPAYAPAKDGGFASESLPVTIANSFAKATNQVRFAATGATATQIDQVRFTLDLPDAEHAGIARQRTADLIRDFLFQSKIDAKPIHDQIAAGTPGKGALAGGAYEIAGDAKQLTVTFTRTGASAPANQTQGK